jgi:hypothetical protein
LDYRDLAAELLKAARAAGADEADTIVSEGTEFSVTVRKGEIETLTEAGSKALGLRVFVGKRTASTYTSDFSWPTLLRLTEEAVGMARATSEDAAAGLPEETFPPEDVELALFDASALELPPAERIERARRAEAAALAVPGIDNSQGASWGSGEGSMLLASSRGFMGGYRTSSVSFSVVPQAERDGQMERDHWYTVGRGLSDLESPEDVGRKAAERTLRRLGARQVKTAEVPVIFDPETAGEILGTLFAAISGYAVFRNATFLKDRLGQPVASPLVTLVDDGPARARPGLAPVRRRGPADAPKPADREGRAALLAVRRVLGAKDRSEADRNRPPRCRRQPDRGRLEPLLRAGSRDARGDPRVDGPRALRDRSDRLGCERGDGRLLAGRGRPLDRERQAHAPGPRGHDRGQPARDADGRGRGRQRPGLPRIERVTDDPDQADDGERQLAVTWPLAARRASARKRRGP